MNITEKIAKAIEDERAKANDPSAINAKVRAAIIENPWSEKHRNLTRQIELGMVAPDVAAVLKAHPGYTVPELYDLLPAKAQKVVQGVLAGCRKDNTPEM